MSKPLNVVLSSLLLFALYFGSALIVQSCGQKDKTEESQSANDKLEDIADDNSSDSFFEDDDVSYSSDVNQSDDDVDENVEVSDEIDYTTTDTPDPTPVTVNRTQSSNSTGRYLIVAGNYLVESNADAMVRKLNNLGYSAEKVVFDLSQYHTVIAGRYSSRSTANDRSASLKSKGYDNYVLTSK